MRGGRGAVCPPRPAASPRGYF
ncbi:hypothetical protein [Pararhodobacter sp.]